MVEEKFESTRNLLDEIEGDWDSPKPGAVAPSDVPAAGKDPPASGSPTERRLQLHAALDAAAERLVDSLDPPPISVPSMEDLDSGWGGDEDDDDEDDEQDEDEPELPDERLDPVAYAAAKEAREERVEARRQRRRAKADAKKARRKARLDAQRSKQKGKQKKARAPQKPARPSKEGRDRARRAASAEARAKGSDEDAGSPAEDHDRVSELEAASAPARTRAKLPPSKPMARAKPMLSKTNQWMLAVAVVIFLAAAIFAAVVAR